MKALKALKISDVSAKLKSNSAKTTGSFEAELK
jgi:hypothetical protein